METLFGKSAIREFEYRLSEYLKVPYVIATCNASVAILGVFYTMNIKDSEVITTPLTWAGALTPLGILKNKLVFADVEPKHLTIDPNDIEKKITEKTRAVFTADFLGYPCKLDEIRNICDLHGLILIHDAASSFGSCYKDFFSGHYADISIFSFEYNKIMNLGEGGCIVTRNKSLYEKLTIQLSHPDVQMKQLNEINPFFLKTAMNPLAARYGIDSFDMLIEKFTNHKKRTIKWFYAKGIDLSDNDCSPNLHHVVMKLDKLAGIKDYSELLIMELPYYPIYWNHNIHSFFETRNINCAIAENAFNNYGVVKLQQNNQVI